jgi:hypothetical protein
VAARAGSLLRVVRASVILKGAWRTRMPPAPPLSARPMLVRGFELDENPEKCAAPRVFTRAVCLNFLPYGFVFAAEAPDGRSPLVVFPTVKIALPGRDESLLMMPSPKSAMGQKAKLGVFGAMSAVLPNTEHSLQLASGATIGLPGTDAYRFRSSLCISAPSTSAGSKSRRITFGQSSTGGDAIRSCDSATI